jgi:chloramphenicol-sensitive protein RarD
MSSTPDAAAQSGDSPKGFVLALSAYFLWGFLPLFMKAIAHISPPEVIAHRVIWSVPIAGAVLLITGRTQDLKAALKSPRTILMAALTASIITVNWGIYVWSIAADRALESALGYYINPLFSVFLAAVLLGEKLSTTQWLAIALAVCAVAILAIEAGGLPWVSISLAVTWGFYAFFRKTLPVGPNQGFLLEVLILSIPSLAYIVYLERTGQGHFGDTGFADVLWLLSCGIVTAVPLMLYGNGAKLLRLSTIGIMQYIAPTMIFLTAVFVFKEPFGASKLAAFALIWVALVIFTWPMIKAALAARRHRVRT